MDWNWSFRAFRLLGIDVRVHWSLPAFFLYYVARAGQLGVSVAGILLFTVLPMALLFASVVAHEYGHALTARSFGLPVGNMVLTPMGGMVMVAQGRTPRHELFVAAAGPMVNLVLALAGVILYLGLGGPLGLELFFPFGGAGRLFLGLWSEGRLGLLVLLDFVQLQMSLVLFNVFVAAYPMDGGRMLMSVLWRRSGFRAGLVSSCKVAQVIAVAMGLVGLVTGELMLMVIALFVFLQASRTLQIAPQLPDPGGGFGYGGGYAPAARRGAFARTATPRAGEGMKLWPPAEWLRRFQLRRRWRKLERELRVLEGGAGKDAPPREGAPPGPPKKTPKDTDWN